MSDGKSGPTTLDKFNSFMVNIFDKPITIFREKIVDPIQSRAPKQYYYHRFFRRVPTIDQCGVDDSVCKYEANEQFARDKRVESQILKILRQRRIECNLYEGVSASEKCRQISEDYEDAATNWYIKYGEIGVLSTAEKAYMKQKHRLIYERRQREKHGENHLE